MICSMWREVIKNNGAFIVQTSKSLFILRCRIQEVGERRGYPRPINRFTSLNARRFGASLIAYNTPRP